MLLIFGGIGIFLLGMTMLTNGLKEITGDTLKRWLNRFTKGTFSAIISGATMTMLLQSSTATTLLTIGFVSAGLITFVQSIGVIIGANIGSTSTGWLISLVGFKISFQTLSLPIIGVGVFMSLIAPNDIKKFGGVLTGFGLLFLGIDLLQQGMGTAQDFISFEFLRAGSFIGVLLLILIGLIMTVIMQASSAAMAATLAALYTGAIGFEQAAYLVIGQNIGTTATAVFAAIGLSVSAKRTAMTHLLFNVVTALIVTLTFPYFLIVTKWTTSVLAGQFDETLGLAIFHTLFSVLGALLFVPFIKQFATLIQRIIPERENVLARNLDESLANEPSVAIDVAYKVLRDMMIQLTDALHVLLTQKKATIEYEKKLREVGEAIDIMRAFLKLIRSNSAKERNKLIIILHSLDHFTRLIKMLRAKQKLDAIYLQEQLIGEWHNLLTEIKESIQDEDQLLEISIRLAQFSQQMASERRERRNQYFELTVADETELDSAVSKVEALLWIDSLIFHYWRATARMAELKAVKDE